jgi:hypothetical protein
MWDVVLGWVSTVSTTTLQLCSSLSWSEPASFAPRVGYPTRTMTSWALQETRAHMHRRHR